jgi:hypothetical protein
MATASTARAALVTGKSSSFGQFRLTQFVDNALQPPSNSNATDARHTSALLSSELTGTEQMAQAPRPSSGQNTDHIPSVAPSRSTPQDHDLANSSPAGLGPLELVELTANPLIEGILGPNKDGRVRNPVPSKLKGKTDNKQGNFGVMHMGVGMSPGKKNEPSGRDAAAERDAAARRTSENTASRAKAAQSEKYVPPKKRGLEASLGDGQPASRGSPFAVSKDHQRARPLAPDETKFEQARLLTLLRSINPVTVVDQICKAVAYFGGIPGAPPPEDGIFPESANTRETGALFIGWLAEIFPDVTARSPEVPKDPLPGGGKKRGAHPLKGKAAMSNGANAGDAEPPNSRNGYGYGPAVSAPAWGLPASLSLVNTSVPQPPIPLPESGRGSVTAHEQSKQFEQQPPLTPIKQQSEEAPNNTASASKRRRGRPKGSRNKGRIDGQSDGPNDVQVNAQSQGQQAPQSPEAQVTTSNVVRPQPPALAAPSFAPAPNTQPVVSKQAQTLQYPDQSWQSNSQQNQISHSSASAVPPEDELSPEERAVLEAFRHHGSGAMSVVPSPIVSTKSAPGTGTGQKRKRAPPKPKAPTAPPANFPTPNPQPLSNTLNQIPNNQTPLGMAKEALQWAPVDTSTPTAPPAKRPRQRKPKAPSANDPSSRKDTVSIVSSATPPTITSTIPDSAVASSQQSMPAVRPPAEGLEAHYERFANLSNQQNGRSHTPTLQQQQVRQQPKPTSVPPPQSTPQVQQQQSQQVQMQHQKSQQNSQQNIPREDQKITQGTSARPSSTGYYNQQRSQSSTAYSQQYPSQQPSQLYGGHQPSPQMSNNSYRTSSTHTLAQASPQFSQAENTYRTASPHTIAQPSPSFSQTDTSNFRTNSSHNLARPSPSFSQPENTYRTPSTHSMAQPAPSYTSSRTHPQTQPAHQNHYNHFSDSSYIDLPTLESLGHSGSSGNASVGLGAGGYGQGLGAVGLVGGSSRSSATSNSLYGTSASGLGSYDTGANDLLRGVSRSGNSTTAYGTSSSGLGSYDTSGTSEHEMRERLLRGLGRG